MPVYGLTDELLFPNPEFADKEGLLAVGGDLSRDRLLLAYSSGIFPWYSDEHPILWWSPDPRMILFPQNFRRSKSLTKVIYSGKFEVRIDTDFKSVIENCAKTPRKGHNETWITDEMKEAYIVLHESGYCHSVETYLDGRLVGGLYGLSLGGVFFGESMFHHVTDASKVALWHLVELATKFDFDMIDVQQETRHLKSLGANPVSRQKFLTLLNQSLKKKTLKGNWSNF
jgi:leucyl/phenylalanyl-tRNA--protein transferase